METADEMWLQGIRDCLNGNWVKSRIEDSMETIGWCQTLDTCNYTFLMNRRRQLSMIYAMAELIWYLSGQRTIEMIAAYAPQYVKFANKGIAWGAYGWRWQNDPTFLSALGHEGNQLQAVIDLLRAKSTDRRAVVTMWNAGDLAVALNTPMNDMPCTLSWQFIRRGDRLHMVCTIRSEDLWLGMPYDIFVNTCIQRLIANSLGIEPGSYTHQVGSLHVYESSLRKVHEALDAKCGTLFMHEWNLRPFDLEAETSVAVTLESLARNQHHIYYDTMLSLHPVLHDAVLLCASKWCPVTIGKLQSRVLRTEYERRLTNVNH